MAEDQVRRPVVMDGGSYIKIPDFTSNTGAAMVWPNPEAAMRISHALRYGPGLTRSEQLVAASVLDAYWQLTVEATCTQRVRNERVKDIRAALEHQRRENPDA